MATFLHRAPSILLHAARASMAPDSPAGGAPASAGPVDPNLIEDLVAANRILADQGVLDGYGHVSVRHPGNSGRYLLSRSLAPELVTAGDIMGFDLDSNPVDQRGRTMYLERFIHGEIYKARPDVECRRPQSFSGGGAFRRVERRAETGLPHERLPASRRAGVRDSRSRRNDRPAGA